MSTKEKLIEAANELDKLADMIERSNHVDSAITKLKQANVISTDIEENEQRSKFASMSLESINDVARSLIGITDRLGIKSASLGSAVINQDSSGLNRWSRWSERLAEK